MNTAWDSRVTALGAGIGLTIGGFAAALLANLVLWALVGVAGVSGADPVRIAANKSTQAGFLLVALGFLAVRSEWGQYVRIRRPTIRDAAWAVAIPLATLVAGRLLAPVWGLFVQGGHGSAGGSETVALAGEPALWPVAFAVWFLFAAPAEELLFRGVIQGHLRRVFGAPAAVVLASLCFGLVHVLFGSLGDPSALGLVVYAVNTFVGGLVFGVAYERTDNLLVPVVGHALEWTAFTDLLVAALPVA